MRRSGGYGGAAASATGSLGRSRARRRQRVARRTFRPKVVHGADTEARGEIAGSSGFSKGAVAGVVSRGVRRFREDQTNGWRVGTISEDDTATRRVAARRIARRGGGRGPATRIWWWCRGRGCLWLAGNWQRGRIECGRRPRRARLQPERSCSCSTTGIRSNTRVHESRRAGDGSLGDAAERVVCFFTAARRWLAVRSLRHPRGGRCALIACG